MEFPRDIACMFLILKYQKDKRLLKELLESREAFQNIGADTYETIFQYTNGAAPPKRASQTDNEKGEIHMWQALNELIEDGRKEGLQQGIRIFILDNQEEQIPKERIIGKLQRRFSLNAEEANSYYDQYAE